MVTVALIVYFTPMFAIIFAMIDETVDMAVSIIRGNQ